MKRRVITMTIDDAGEFGVDVISLVEEPAIREKFIALSDVKLSAVDTERRIVYGAVLVPDRRILRVDEETGEEYYIEFPKDVVMKAAHNFMLSGRLSAANIEHSEAVEDVTVVESWLKEGDSDKSIALGLSADLPVMTWFAGQKINNDSVWDKVKAGEVSGFSIEGTFGMVRAMMRESELLAELEAVILKHIKPL